MFDAIKDALYEVNRIIASSEDALKMQTNSHASSNDHAQYCGPYRLEKTLGKGQTGQFTFINRI